MSTYLSSIKQVGQQIRTKIIIREEKIKSHMRNPATPASFIYKPEQN